MNHNYCVPDFEIYDDELANPSASTSQARPKKSAVADEDVTELVWQNGQVVLHSQNQRSHRRANIGDVVLPAEFPPPRQILPEEETAVNLFMQEDEMSNWLHYPIDDSTPFERDLYADLLYPTASAPAPPATRLAPTTDVLNAEFKPRKQPEATEAAPVHDFSHFSMHKGRVERGGPSISNKTIEPTVVDSSDTPAFRGAAKSRFEHFNNSAMHISARTLGYPTTISAIAALGTSSAAAGETDMRTYDFTTSPGDSGASASASVETTTPKPAPSVTEDRKRKGREADDADCQNEDVDVEYCDVKQRVHGSTSTKRSRAAEVHNQSERRRRDRINVKMKALQELIPRCNKSDKASMLDEAIEYLKSLQMQVQMMSMGCTMVPMMFPGVQHYMPSMGMGIDMGMIRPMMQFPPVLPGSAGTNMTPRFPIPNFHLPSDPNRIQATNLPDPMMNSSAQNLSHPQMQQQQQQNIVDPYQQYLIMQQSRASLAQNPQLMNQPNINNPGGNDHGNLQSG